VRFGAVKPIGWTSGWELGFVDPDDRTYPTFGGSLEVLCCESVSGWRFEIFFELECSGVLLEADGHGRKEFEPLPKCRFECRF